MRNNFWILCFLLFDVVAYAVGNPTVTGSIQRGDATESFTVTITVPDVQKTTIFGTEKDLFKDRLQFYLTDIAVDKDKFVPFEGDAPNGVVNFTVAQSNDLQIKPNATGMSDFVYTATITSTSAGALKALLDKNASATPRYVKLLVKYYEDKQAVSTATEGVKIEVSSAIAKEAPANFTLTGTHKQLDATFDSKSSIAFSNGKADSTGTPSSVVMVALATNSTITNLPAYEYNSEASTDTAAPSGTCGIQTNFSNGNNCVTCAPAEKFFYLDTEKLSQLKDAGVFVKRGKPGDGKVSIVGLENGQQYNVFLYFEPGGLAQSICRHAAPEANKSLTELLGESEAQEENPRCFVATAAYGTPLHKNIKVFTWFRSRVLLKTQWGKSFIHYYNEYGPIAASYIADRPMMRMAVRMVLWPPALILKTWQMFDRE